MTTLTAGGTWAVSSAHAWKAISIQSCGGGSPTPERLALEGVLEPPPAGLGSIEIGRVDDGDAALPGELDQLAVVGEDRRGRAEGLGEDGGVEAHRDDQRRLAEHRGDAADVDRPRQEVDGVALAHARDDGAVQRVVVLRVVLLEGQEGDPAARARRARRARRRATAGAARAWRSGRTRRDCRAGRRARRGRLGRRVRRRRHSSGNRRGSASTMSPAN